jgi:hypothetical protein
VFFSSELQKTLSNLITLQLAANREEQKFSVENHLFVQTMSKIKTPVGGQMLETIFFCGKK